MITMYHHLPICVRPHILRRVVITVALALALFLPATVSADAPGTRGDPPLPQGSASRAGAPADGPQVWQGVQPLTPPGATTPATPVRFGSPGDWTGETQSWLGRNLNPGNWVLDAGMGVVAGVIATVGATEERAARTLLGAGDGDSWSIVPRTCNDNQATNFVFCTPPELTYAHPNLPPIWNIMRAAAQALATTLFLVRISRLLAEGARSLAEEGKRLLLTFMGVSLFVNTTAQTLGFVIDIFNAMSEALLARAHLDLLTPLDANLNLGSYCMYAVFWTIMLLLIFKSFFRLINIIVLVGVAPVAGALLMDRATAPRFHGWLQRLIDLLFEQVALTITIVVAVALLQPFRDGSVDVFVNFLLGSATLLMAAYGAPQLTGVARTTVQGGYLRARLQHTINHLGSRAGKGVKHGAGATAAAIAAAWHANRPSRRPTPETVAANTVATDGRSAAAPRTREDRAPDATHPARRNDGRPATTARPSEPMEGATLRNRQERAAARARHMRAQADEIEGRAYSIAPGDGRRSLIEQAHALRRRADLQQRFAQGKLLPRRSPWTDEQKQRRRAIWRAALLEMQGAHDVERAGVVAAIEVDQRNLHTVPAGERAPIMAQIHLRQTRAAELTPAKGETLAMATRVQAAQVARQRLAAEGLMSPPRPVQQPPGQNQRTSGKGAARDER